MTIRLLILLTGVNDNLTPDEPPAKRRRVARGSPQGEWDDGNVSENSNSCETEHTVYTAELIVFDNNKHCLLTDGDYELALSEKHKRPGRKKGILSNRTSWENVFEGQVSSRETLTCNVCLFYQFLAINKFSYKKAIHKAGKPTKA